MKQIKDINLGNYEHNKITIGPVENISDPDKNNRIKKWSSPQLTLLNDIEKKIIANGKYDNELFAQDLIVCKSLTSYFSRVIYNKIKIPVVKKNTLTGK